MSYVCPYNGEASNLQNICIKTIRGRFQARERGVENQAGIKEPRRNKGTGKERKIKERLNCQWRGRCIGDGVESVKGGRVEEEIAYFWHAKKKGHDLH